LIVTSSETSNVITYNTIYKFNAATKQLVTLYSTKNWADATNNIPYGGTSGNTGFYWLGTHIYYANNAHSPMSQGLPLSTALFRLNDNGITPKIYTVYGKMESANSTQAASSFSFFQGK